MSRPRADIRLLLPLLLMVFAPPPAACAQSPAEVVDQYLVEHGLARLRARMLEQELANTAGSARVELAEKLADLYSDELNRAESSAEQREWEKLARGLLARVPEIQSVAMRLELAKARFAAVERTAEEWRLRMIAEADAIAAAEVLRDLAAAFQDLAGKAHLDVRTLETQEESPLAGDTDLIAESLAQSRQQRSIAHYLAGWCLLYLAEMSRSPEEASRLAGDAAEQFSWLIGPTPTRVPALDRVPEQLLKYEHMARAAIAIGACESLRGNTADALSWLDVVARAPETPPGVASPLLARRIWVLARDNRWSDIDRVIAERRAAAPGQESGGGSTLSVAETRLLAVLCLENGADSPARRGLLTTALADLVSTGEHAHLLDLAKRYGASALALQGFLGEHLSGVRVYDEARIAHRAAGESDQVPTSRPAIGAMYARAADAFDAANSASDAAQFPETHAANLMLLGLSLYFAGEFAGDDTSARAVNALLEARDKSLNDSLASESMWMAIRTLEVHLERHPQDRDARSRMLELMAGFTDRYPGSDRSSEIALRRALSDARADETSLRLLLTVPESAPLYDSARRHAEQIAYELFRAAPPTESAWLASRFITIADPLLSIDRRRALQGDADAANNVVLRSRRMIESLLALSPPDHDRAERVLDALSSMIASGRVKADDLTSELAFRRAQIALARGDESGAAEIVRSLQARDPDLADAASRLVIRHVASQWSTAPAGSETRLGAARRLLSISAPATTGPLSTTELKSDHAAAALRVIVAQAAVEVWRADNDRVALALARRLADELGAAFPNDERVLTVRAESAEANGDLAAALEHWRVLAAASRTGSDIWFERRVRQLQVLARVDPERARAALTQHRTLYPAIAPEPYRTSLLELERSLGQSGGATP